MADHDRAEAVQRLKLAKIHLPPRLLERCPRRIARRFDSVWAPVEELTRQLRPLPVALIQFMASAPRGHMVLTAEDSSYEVGAHSLRGREWEAVALISLTDLVTECSEGGRPLRALHMVGHLLDHLLGCQGAPQGEWLSDGHGLNLRWAEVGQQMSQFFELGHAVDRAAAASPRQYVARSFAWYIRDRRRLNAADPLIEKLLRRTLFDEGFCRRTLPRPDSGS